MDFREWLLNEERHLIPVPVANSWEGGFQDELVRLIARTKHPALRSEFQKMRSCPVRDNRGNCRGFVDYITGTMIRNRCGLRDPEDSLARVCHQLLTPVNLQVRPRATLFGNFDETKPFIPGTNPLEARFKTSVGNAVRNLCDSDRRTERHATVSIVTGRDKERTPGAVSADRLPARDDHAERELFAGIEHLLQRRQEQHPDIPLVDLFRSIVSGDNTRALISTFGTMKVKTGREIVIQAIRDYARSTENEALLRLLDKPVEPNTVTKQVKLPPDQQDFASIVSVMERNGRRVTLSQLQKDRRRWMERSPRDPKSPHPNRLDDVLANMLAASVLVEKRTRKGGRYFEPGPEYGKYVPGGIESD